MTRAKLSTSSCLLSNIYMPCLLFIEVFLLSFFLSLPLLLIFPSDIKPENMLLSSKESLTIKLSDFGFAKIFEETMKMNTTVGSPGYVAPEVLFDDNYGSSVDMWSVGVITYTLLSGDPPFYHAVFLLFTFSNVSGCLSFKSSFISPLFLVFKRAFPKNYYSRLRLP